MSFLHLGGRVAVVTGAAQGMGFATSQIMSREGMQVAMIDINREAIEQAAASLNQEGGAPVKAFACDVSDDEAIAKTVEEIHAHFGQIDVLVNVAGILTATKIWDMTRTEWDRVLGVNLSGAFFLIQKCLPYLKESKCGRIINVSSTAARGGGVTNSQAYTASKGALVSITKGIARQVAPFGITCNAICPGPTRTPLTDAYTEEELENLIAQGLAGRLGEPSEMGCAICYLASEEAGFVTGAALDINGGFWIGA